MAKLKIMKEFLNDDRYAGMISKAQESSREAQWSNWYGDYPVVYEMVELMQLLGKAMPHVKVYPTNFELIRATLPEGLACTVINEFCIYMDEYPFDLGRVGWNSYAVGDYTNSSYGVYSRKIHNEKFAYHRDQYHMVMTLDAKKAAKNACKYIVPYTHKELATAFYVDARSEVESVYDKAQEKMNAIAYDLRYDSKSILAEILHLKKLGIEFKTEAFRKAASGVEEAVNKFTEEDNRVVQMLFVRFRKVGEDMYVDVQEVSDVRRNGKPTFVSPQITCAMSDLPEDIAGSISVLNILDDKQYVARVGQKIDETTFYVERG
jgi:hypothetical protein